MEDQEIVLYRGSINFSHSIIWFCVLCVTFGAIYFALPPLIELFGGDFVFPTVVEISAISFTIGIFLPILLLVIKLKIQVRTDGIYLKIIPFHFSYRRIAWSELVNYEPYECSQKEINRLGIRQSIAGNAYALGGKRGVRLDFASGKTIFLESKKPEKIIEIMRTIINKNGP